MNQALSNSLKSCTNIDADLAPSPSCKETVPEKKEKADRQVGRDIHRGSWFPAGHWYGRTSSTSGASRQSQVEKDKWPIQRNNGRDRKLKYAWSAVALMAVLVLIFFHISGAAVPVESRLLSVEQILQVPQDLLHLILGGILLLLFFFILEAMCKCFFCKGPKLDKDSRRGPDVVDLKQLIRIGQVVLLLFLILLLSTLPLLILGIVRRWFLMKKK